MSTTGPIAFGPIAASNLEIFQSSSGELYVLGQSQLALTVVKISAGALEIAGSSDALYVPAPSIFYPIESNGSLELQGSSALTTILNVNSQGDLVLAGTTNTELLDIIEINVNSTGALVLAGTTGLAITVPQFYVQTSLGELELAGTTGLTFTDAIVYQLSSSGELEISSVTAFATVSVLESSGAIILDGESNFGEGKSTIVNSVGALEVAASTSTEILVRATSTGQLILASTTAVTVQRPLRVTVNSSGALLLAGTTALVTRIFTRVAFDSNLDIEIGGINSYVFPYRAPTVKSRPGSKQLKSEVSRQVAFLSHVRIGRPRVESQVGFYPAPPEIIVPPKRPQGPFGKFLDQFGNKLTYKFDSTTGIVNIGVSSTVEVENSGTRDLQIRNEDSLLLGLDEDTILLDSTTTWGLIEDHMDKNHDHMRRLQEDKDLLGITD